jgi:hypothetical protein
MRVLRDFVLLTAYRSGPLGRVSPTYVVIVAKYRGGSLDVLNSERREGLTADQAVEYVGQTLIDMAAKATDLQGPVSVIVLPDEDEPGEAAS